MTFDFANTADEILDLQDKVDKIEAKAAAQTKDFKARIKELEELLLAALQDADMKSFTGKKSVAEVKESLRISIKDFEELEKFIIRKKALNLFERRISSTAYKEQKELLGGKPIPGLSEFTQARLNVKKAK